AKLAAMTTPPAPAEPTLDADGAATDAGIKALAEQLAAGAKPFADSADTDAGGLPQAEAAVAMAGDASGVLRSLRPRQRPAALKAAFASGALPVAAAVQTGPIATAPAAVEEIDPATIETGTRLAQLGAYDSEDDARKDWTRLHGSFEDYMEGKARVIQKASSGGRTFYRLRAMGFTDLSDARRFCAAFVAQDAECIPVVTR
ncbi:SPOR domain-containing protein, partial [Pseudooceanicola sp.]|uniref:SPOR domain-containing protein n=1 Tax=Pseudooceanicola sp. TaxID=1914328 RepID=UPI004059A5FC